MKTPIVETASTPEILTQIIDLRYAVLRKPWNKSRETASDELEHSSINAFINKNGKIVACGRLQNNGNNIGQIRFMAVDDKYQGKGYGRLILQKLEQEAKKLALNSIELQARENALEFYLANGYSAKEKSFKLWDIIQHYLMEKQL